MLLVDHTLLYLLLLLLLLLFSLVLHVCVVAVGYVLAVAENVAPY